MDRPSGQLINAIGRAAVTSALTSQALGWRAAPEPGPGEGLGDRVWLAGRLPRLAGLFLREPGPLTPACPTCGLVSVPVVPGLPDVRLIAAAGRGLVHLAGCIVSGDDLPWICRRGHRWQEEDQDRWDAAVTAALDQVPAGKRRNGAMTL